MEVGEAESGLGLKGSRRSRPLKSIQLSDARGRTHSGHYTSLEGDTLTSVLLQNRTDQEAFVEADLQEPETLQTPVPSQVQGHDGVLVSPSTESGSMTTAAQPNPVPAANSSHASRSHSQTDGIVEAGWKVSYWITALSFAAFISILCMYVGDNSSDKIHKPLFKACILSVGASFAMGLGLIALLQMAAHSSIHIQSLIILVKILEYCGIGFVALAFGTGSYVLFGKMYIEFVFIIPIAVLVIGLVLMFCHRNDGNQSEDPV